MSILDFQVDTLLQMCASEKESERLQARENLQRILSNLPANRISYDPEYLIRELLLELGTPDHLVGHPYVVQGVLLAVENRSYIDNITFGLYPKLALMFDSTPGRVERGIRHLIELTWSRGNWEILNQYFGNSINPTKGKPTNGEFLARITNLVILRMKKAA
jgi:two-component system response regulator (stage 0 sporulation protein A)